MDLAITDTTLLTFEGKGLGVIENGAVGIDMDKISFVGKTRDIHTEDYNTVMNGSDLVTMPGLVDAHIHSGFALLRGCAQDVPEKEWMDKALGPIAKHMTEEDRILGSKLGVLEALRSGTTTFGEFTGNIDEVIEQVYHPFNARVVGAERINEVVNRDGETYELERSTETLQTSEELFKKYNPDGNVDIMYGPQALDMVTLDTLKKIYERAEKQDRKIHMHVAQGGREREQIENRYGTSTVKKLREEDMLNEKLLAAHCHGTTKEEKKALVENGVRMVGCPSSIAMIDGVTPPIRDFLSLGGSASIGTDQVPGNGAHNLMREMRTISLLSKCKNSDPTALPPWKTLELATKGGAEALGIEEKVGTLKEGKRADIITVDLDNLNLTPPIREPFRSIIPNLVYSSTGLEVNDVIINGKKVVRNKRFVNIDENRIEEKANSRAREILKKAEEDWKEADSAMVGYSRDGLL